MAIQLDLSSLENALQRLVEALQAYKADTKIPSTATPAFSALNSAMSCHTKCSNAI